MLITVLVAIMILPQGLDYSSDSSGMPTEGDAISRATWLFLLSGGMYLAFRHSRRTMAMLRSVDRWILVFAVLATASILWSIEPAVTTRRLIRVYSTLLACLGLTIVGWHPKRFQSVMRTLLSAVLLASLIFVYWKPLLAIHWTLNHPELYGAWHGITTGKNLLGSLASACLVLWIHAWIAGEQKWWKCIPGAALSLSCLLGSHSSTSLMATMFAIMFMLLLLRSPHSMRRYMPYIVVVFALIILIYALAILRLVPGLDAVLTPIAMISGKDTTFTGRTNIWYILHLHIRQHPWFGTGYGAYWVGPLPSSPSYEMLGRLFFYPNEGHNGYMDVINDLGFVGGFVLFAYFWVYVRQSLQLMRIDRYQGGLYLTLMFRGFLADMSESHWFSVLSIDFITMTVATFCLGRSVLQLRLDAGKARAAPPAAPRTGKTPSARPERTPPPRFRPRNSWRPADRYRPPVAPRPSGS